MEPLAQVSTEVVTTKPDDLAANARERAAVVRRIADTIRNPGPDARTTASLSVLEKMKAGERAQRAQEVAALFGGSNAGKLLAEAFITAALGIKTKSADQNPTPAVPTIDAATINAAEGINVIPVTSAAVGQ
jgi:hypothetical protein